MWYFTVFFFFLKLPSPFSPTRLPKILSSMWQPIWGMQKSTLRQLDPQYILSNETKGCSNWLAYEFQIWRSFWFWVWLSFPARLIPSWLVRSILGQEIVLRNQTLLFTNGKTTHRPSRFQSWQNHSHASMYQNRPYIIACFTVLGSFFSQFYCVF